MNKLILSGKEVMDAIKKGVDLVANPVKASIGPLGRTTIIAQSMVADYGVRNYPVAVTKDGWKISQSISSPDPLIQVGVNLIQEACDKQMVMVGDATSTTALLTQAILEGGMKLIEDGANHLDVINGINKAVEYVVNELKKMSTPINGDVEKIRQVATISANNDEFIGNLIAEAFDKIGEDGVITIEEAKGRDTSIKISDGLKFSRGWVSPYFITNKTKGEAELLNPYILIYDRPITMLNDTQNGTGILPIIQQISATGKRPLVIFCDDCDGEALATLTFNTQQGNFQSCVVSMAFLGQNKRDFMEDIAAATGGTFISELKGTKLENVTIEMLGQAQKVTVGKEETVIVGGNKNEAKFDELVLSLKELEAKEEDSELNELIKKRIARLKGSVAILSVGATTEIEMKEKKDRVDDSVRATRSAIEEGYLPGGGISLFRVPLPIAVGIKDFSGYDVVFDILGKSLEQLCINSGASFGDIVKQIENSPASCGYNAKTGKIENLVASGIIEPTKSNRCALQNAASVVCQILSSQYMIVDTL